jgi:hypothetical protein
MTLYILYSADYELFLGGNYCDEIEVLIEPTNDILNLFDRLNIPITLFADVFSFLRYREHNMYTFPENAENQLKDAIRRGHDVQSHVHPHWNYTRIDGRKYTVSGDYFLLGKLDDDPSKLYAKIRNLLLTSRNYLEDLLGQVDTDYTCIAFRAGGYGLQPNPVTVIKALHDSGFIIDSSVVPGFVLRNKVNDVDFTHTPKMANYYLETDLTVPSENNQGIFEIPLASCRFSIGENSLFQASVLLKFLLTRFGNKKSKDFSLKEKGYPIQHDPGRQSVKKKTHSKLYNFISDTINDRYYYLDCTTDDKKMLQCTKKYLDNFDFVNNDVFFAFNMHPKGMGKEHFAALERYHILLKEYYKDNLNTISYQQAAGMLSRQRNTKNAD